MNALLRLAWILALIVSVLALGVEWYAKASAVEAYIIAAKDPSMVEMNRATFIPSSTDKSSPEFRREVMAIYGSPSDDIDRVLFVPHEKFVRPGELPGLVLLPVDKMKNENPQQLKSVLFFTRPVRYGALFMAFIAYVVWRLKRRQEPPPPAPAAP